MTRSRRRESAFLSGLRFFGEGVRFLGVNERLRTGGVLVFSGERFLSTDRLFGVGFRRSFTSRRSYRDSRLLDLIRRESRASYDRERFLLAGGGDGVRLRRASREEREKFRCGDRS